VKRIGEGRGGEGREGLAPVVSGADRMCERMIKRRDKQTSC